MPSSFIIDKKGVVRKIHLGFNLNAAAEIEAQILSILNEAPWKLI